MAKTMVRMFKQCIAEILVDKYHLSEMDARRAIKNSYLDGSLKISVEDTLHEDTEMWADDIYEYIYGTENAVEL